MSVSVVKSSRGSDLLAVENFLFCKQDLLRSGEMRWRCIKKNFKCVAKLYTVGSVAAEYAVTRSNLTHNHEADRSSLQRKIVMTACKRKAQEDMSEKPSKILKSILSTDLPEKFTKTDIKLLRRCVYNNRRRLVPTMPKIQEVHTVLDLYAETTTGENFLFNNRSAENIVYVCQKNNRGRRCSTILILVGYHYPFTPVSFKHL